MNDFEIVKNLTSRADYILHIRNFENEKERINTFQKLCNQVLQLKNPNVAYMFARNVSSYMEGDVKKVFDVKKFEDLMIKSNDEDLIYMFGRDIEGANLKRLVSKLSSNYAKAELDDSRVF